MKIENYRKRRDNKKAKDLTTAEVLWLLSENDPELFNSLTDTEAFFEKKEKSKNEAMTDYQFKDHSKISIDTSGSVWTEGEFYCEH